MARSPLMAAMLAAALALLPGLARAIAYAQPNGMAQVELDLSNGETVDFSLPVRYASSRTLDPKTPQSRCQPPLIRDLTFDVVELGPQMAASMLLSFDGTGPAQPFLLLAGSGGLNSTIDPGLTADSTPGEIARLAPQGGPERAGADWRIVMGWDFEPAPIFDASAPVDWGTPVDQPLPNAPPRWISPQSGEPTDITITRARIATDLRLAAQYEMPGTGEIRPCP